MRHTRRLTVWAVGFVLLALTPNEGVASCAPYISCTSTVSPCSGELTDGFTFEFDTNIFTWGPISITGSGASGFNFPTFCFEFCKYEVTTWDGEVFNVHTFDGGCDGSGTAIHDPQVTMTDVDGTVFDLIRAPAPCGAPALA